MNVHCMLIGLPMTLVLATKTGKILVCVLFILETVPLNANQDLAQDLVATIAQSAIPML